MVKAKKEKKVASKKKVEKELKTKKSSSPAKEKKATKKEKAVETVTPSYSMNALLDYMTKSADVVEKEENLTANINDSYRLSTGLLVLDMLLDGGICSSWYSVSGEEASWKTGSAITMVKAAADNQVPLIYYMDAENALKTKAVKATFKTDNADNVFGKRDEKGTYLTRPLVRYSDDQRLEKVFTVLKKTLLRLPDKQQSAITGKWYYVFDRTKDDKKKWEAMGLSNPDKKLFTLTGSYWFEAPDDNLQFFAVIDSLPALVPEVSAENEDGTDNSIALLARCLAKWIPQVKGLLKRKHAAILVVNQIRAKPLVMYGPTEGEPGGNAAKFFSDYRLKFAPKAIPTPAWDRQKGNSYICEEPSVEGPGKDYYMMKSVKVLKTKTDAAGQSSVVRIWCKDCNGKYRASDPVFDAWQVLSTLNLVSGNRKKEFTIDLKCCEGIKFDWNMFKLCILIEVKKSKELWKKLQTDYKVKFTKPLKIRKALSDIIKAGNLEQYMNRKSNEEAETALSLEDDE